jgi:hypothetical protein
VEEVAQRGANHSPIRGAACHYLADVAKGRNVRVMMPYLLSRSARRVVR